MTLAQQVGAELRRIRNGRSHREIAEELDCRQPQLRKIEAGSDNPTLARLERIAAAYGASLSIKARPAKEEETA